MSMFAASSSLEQRRWQGLMCALAGAVAFSGKAIVAKLLYRQGADAFAVVGLRMAMAFPLFLLMAWWSSRGRPTESGAQAPMSGKLAWQVLGLGFCGYYLASTLDFLGLQYISASLERLILYVTPTVVVLLSPSTGMSEMPAASAKSTRSLVSGGTPLGSANRTTMICRPSSRYASW